MLYSHKKRKGTLSNNGSPLYGNKGKKNKSKKQMKNNEAVNGALALAESVSNFGFMAVAGGVVLLLFILLIIYLLATQRQNNRRATKLQEQNDKRYNDYINSLTDNSKLEHEKQIAGIEAVGKNVSMLLYEHSNLYEKASTIIEMLLQYSACLTIREINNIRHENGVEDRELTHSKCVNRINNITDYRKRRMAIFVYKGKPLNEACDSMFGEEVVSLMHTEIYRNGDNSYIATRNAVEELYDRQKEKMIQIIKEW